MPHAGKMILTSPPPCSLVCPPACPRFLLLVRCSVGHPALVRLAPQHLPQPTVQEAGLAHPPQLLRADVQVGLQGGGACVRVVMRDCKGGEEPARGTYNRG